MNKRWTTSILAIVLALTTLFASAFTVFAKSNDRAVSSETNEAGKNYTISMGEKFVAQNGRAEILLAKSPYSGELDISRLTGTRRTELTAGDINFLLPGLTWEVDNSKDKAEKFVGGARVAFDLANAPAAAIYFRPLKGTTWTKLPTVMHVDKATGGATYSARAMGFGTYGLGMPK